MRPSYVQTSKPATPPVTTDEAMLAARIDGSDDRQLIEGLIDAAVEYVEKRQWSQLVTAEWEMRMNRFPCDVIDLHPNPVQEAEISYVNTAGQTVTLTENTDYVLDTNCQPAVIRPAYNKSWPVTRGYANDVTITLTCGYGTAFDVPPTIKEAIKVLVSHWYEGCADSSIPMAVDALLGVRSFAGFV
jgi:uncharacterized phiE125 gp8 family phage protein